MYEYFIFIFIFTESMLVNQLTFAKQLQKTNLNLRTFSPLSLVFISLLCLIPLLMPLLYIAKGRAVKVKNHKHAHRAERKRNLRKWGR